MKKLEIPNAPTQAYIIEVEIQRSDDSRYDHRLHGVLLVARGKSCKEVSILLGHSVKTIENWVNRFNSGGFEALRDEKRTGRPTKLSQTQLDEVERDIQFNPLELEYNQNIWDGKLLSYHIEKKFNVNLSTRQCQRIFKKFNFRQRKPRPMNAKSDPQKQEEFKKTRKKD